MAQRGVNKAIIVGNLGNDPDSRATQAGGCVTTISVATSETWRDKQTGEQQEKTEWHRIVMFNRLAEIARDFLRKGSKVYVEGKLQTRQWEDSDGNTRYTTEILANELQMLDPRGEIEPQATDAQDRAQMAPAASPAPQPDLDGQNIPF